MTAEIGILNKKAVALAADSAATFSREDGRKILNTANKIFTLSKFHPVGIMIYGSAELCGVPWETIIKVFRKNLGMTKYPSLRDYANKFLEHLDSHNFIFDRKDQDKYIAWATEIQFRAILNAANKEVKSLLSKKKITNLDIQNILARKIKDRLDFINKHQKLKHLPKNYKTSLMRNHKALFSNTISQVFQNLPLTAKLRRHLLFVPKNYFSRAIFLPNISGLVVAGFGEKEIYPSLFQYLVETIVEGRLKYILVKTRSISSDLNGLIIPFAQSEMVQTFMEGIDPEYEKVVLNYIKKILTDLPEAILAHITGLSLKDKVATANKVNKIQAKLLRFFINEMVDYKHTNHIYPVTNTVGFLPIPDLAAMAETLVSITSFKRRITMSDETVGGPIDVAVISKGDGFIWIKRKHYFDKECNQHFIRNYFREYSRKGAIYEEE
jgi:hypothetical protein